MNQTTAGWRPDPYGAHEFRFFSADGKPTLLVMDGETKSYDRAPSVPPTAPNAPPTPQREAPPALEASPALVRTATHLPATELEVDQSVTPAGRAATDANTEGPATRGQARVAPPLMAADRRDVERERGSQQPLSGPRKIAIGIVIGVLALSLLGLVYVHFRPTGGSSTTHAQGAATTTTSRASRTTTTVALPKTLSPSPDAAATALVSSWAAGNRSAALAVAMPAAVTTLFGQSYASGMAEDRGCSTSFTPIVCTFGPPGGAAPTDPIYELSVSQTAGGWYVSSIKIEN